MGTNLNTAKALIRAAFERGEVLTTYTGNQIGHTVDFRKIVSVLIDEGMNIESWWNEQDGRRWKSYRLAQTAEAGAETGLGWQNWHRCTDRECREVAIKRNTLRVRAPPPAQATPEAVRGHNNSNFNYE